MKRALIISSLLLAVACRDFDAHLDAGCENGAAWCRDAGEEHEDAGQTDAGEPDAGQADAGAPDAGGPDGGEEEPEEGDGGPCIGRGGWCWQHPSPLGAMDVTAIWGTADDDVYVGGGGGVLARWNGAQWSQVPFEPAREADDEPTIRIIEPRGAHFLIAGEDMSLWLTVDGGTRLPMSDVYHRWSAAPAADGTVYVLRANSGEYDVVRPTGVVQRVVRPTGIVDSTEAITLYDGGLYFATYSSDAGGRIQYVDGGFPQQSGSGPIDGSPTRFAMLQGAPVMLFTNGQALRAVSDTEWAEYPRFNFGAWIPEAHGFVESDAGVDWWAAGQDMKFKLQTGSDNFEYGEGRSFGRASWVSPSGNFWAVSGNGRVVRMNSTEFEPTDIASSTGPAVTDLAVDGLAVAVAGDEAVVWLRNRERVWQRLQSNVSYSHRAIAVREDRVCVVDGEGHVACTSLAAPAFGTLTYALPLAELDGGVGGDNYALRGGGIGIAPNGLVRASVGGVLSFEQPSGQWTSLNLGRGAITTDLVAEDDGAWVAVGARQGSGNYVEQGQVVRVDVTGGVHVCALPAAAMSGGVYALGRAGVNRVVTAGRGWAGFCHLDGTFEAFSLSGLPLNPIFTSIHFDSQGAVWLLTQNGTTWRRAPGVTNFTRERNPMGWSDTSALSAVRLTGSQKSLWVGVGAGGVLRRPLP